MKKLTLFLSAMLLACATSLWANEVTFSYSDLSGQGASSTGADFTGATKDHITLGGKGNGNTSYVQIYSNGTLTFTPLNGATITKIVLTATNGYIQTWKESKVALTIADNNTATWTGSSTTMVTLTNTATKQARITQMVVTYTLPAAAVADPTISANDGAAVENKGFYTSPLTVTLACETEGAEIHYTTDGTEPTVESTTYSTALTFNNEFVTIRAKAFKGEDASYEAKANYYHNSTLSLPYTTTQAFALYNALGDVAEIFVEGQVTNFEYNSTYKNANYTITDGTTPLYMYRGVAGAACGLADLADLVQGDKVVVKGKLTAHNGTPQLGAGNTIVKWTENTNPVLTCAESIAFGNISSLIGTAPTETLVVTAKNLTEGITATLSENAAFVLSSTTLPAEGGSIVITPVLTVGENTATLTLTSGEKSVAVTLTATIQQAYTISWMVDGQAYTAGTPTTNVIDGEKVTALPTAPADNTLSCSNIFVGWSTNNIGSTAGQTQPADLFTSTGTAPVVTENTTYYAVFATAEGEAKEYFNETFDKTEGTGGNDGSWNGTIASSTLTTDNEGWTFEKAGGASQCAKFGSGSAQGSATTPALTGLTGNAVLTFRAGAWKGDATTLNLSISIGKLSEESVTLADAAFSIYTINITDATAESKIKFTAKQASSARFFLDDVVVKNAVTLKDFRTNCDGISTVIESATVETSVVKTIENGQLIIIRDGKKYNATGIQLQ